jgi:hypothetical protein
MYALRNTNLADIEMQDFVSIEAYTITLAWKHRDSVSKL